MTTKVDKTIKVSLTNTYIAHPHRYTHSHTLTLTLTHTHNPRTTTPTHIHTHTLSSTPTIITAKVKKVMSKPKLKANGRSAYLYFLSVWARFHDLFYLLCGVRYFSYTNESILPSQLSRYPFIHLDRAKQSE